MLKLLKCPKTTFAFVFPRHDFRSYFRVRSTELRAKHDIDNWRQPSKYYFLHIFRQLVARLPWHTTRTNNTGILTSNTIPAQSWYNYQQIPNAIKRYFSNHKPIKCQWTMLSWVVFPVLKVFNIDQKVARQTTGIVLPYISARHFLFCHIIPAQMSLWCLWWVRVSTFSLVGVVHCVWVALCYGSRDKIENFVTFDFCKFDFMDFLCWIDTVWVAIAICDA